MVAFLRRLFPESLFPRRLEADAERRLRLAKAKAEELASLLEIEQERLKISADSTTAQLAAQETKLTQLRGQAELKRQQVEALKIRPGVDGVLQRLGDMANPLQEGQQLPAGALVARVAEPAR